jgi:nucleotide-binding universal stress UspA family protein
MSSAELQTETGFHRIVVGVDGSEQSPDAVRLARRLAYADDASIVLASVAMPDFYGVPDFTPDVPQHQERARQHIDHMRPLLEGFPRWEPEVVEASSAARGLHQVLEVEKADLLVLGATHHGWALSAVRGTVALRLLHGSPCAIAIAGRRALPEGPLTVGVGYDEEHESGYAMEVAAGVARALGGKLRVITAVETPGPGHPEFGTDALRQSADNLIGRVEENIHHLAHQLDLPEGVEPLVTTGSATDALVEASKDLDLLVVGSRAYGPVRSVLLGSVSTPVVQHASSAVLVVPRRGA